MRAAILIDSRGTPAHVNKLITRPPVVVYTHRLQMAPIMIGVANAHTYFYAVALIAK